MKNIQEILQLEPHLIVDEFVKTKKPFKIPFEEIQNQYDPLKHKVMNPIHRKKKTVKVRTDKTDPRTGEVIYKEKKVDRVRVSIPIQKTIVNRSTGFLFSTPVEYKLTGKTDEAMEKIHEQVLDIFHDNKMKYFDKKLARALFSQRECAELWYMVLNETGKPEEMRVKLLTPENGDTLYPHFDDYDRMDAFARKYAVLDSDNRSEVHFDVYTNKFVYRYKYDGGSLIIDENPKQHGFGKIPVIYYRQEDSEWNDVQSSIERVEELMSNWGDTNDYFGSPSYFVKGKLKGFAEKGEQGKVYQGEDNTSMQVLSWDSSPTSIQGELANLFNIIFSYTQTADISFENMKTLGNNTSGAAIKLMFTDPHMKAENKIELFGEMFTRRYNLVLDGLSHTLQPITNSNRMHMRAEPVFKPYMPKNDLEEIQIITTATGGKATMSQEEGVKQNPRIKNPETILEQIQKEQQQAMINDAFGGAI